MTFSTRQPRGRRVPATPEPDDAVVGEPSPDADPVSAARTICLRLLTARSRSRAELAEALHTRGIPDAAAAAVLDRFGEVGLIDDTAFARTFAVSRHQDRGLAAREVARQLREKGVDPDTVSDAVSAIDAETEFDTACRLVERKARSMRALDDATKTRRLVGMLARKGYSPGTAFAVVRRVLGENPSDGQYIDDECG